VLDYLNTSRDVELLSPERERCLPQIRTKGLVVEAHLLAKRKVRFETIDSYKPPRSSVDPTQSTDDASSTP
jgi:hypothetical protein